MSNAKWIVMSAAVLLSASILIAADEAAPPASAPPATQPAAKKIKLTKPFSEITGLTEDQKEAIEKIHKEFLVKQKELEAKEYTDVEPLLTDDQKVQLKAMEPKTMEAKPAKHKKEATTEPAK